MVYQVVGYLLEVAFVALAAASLVILVIHLVKFVKFDHRQLYFAPFDVSSGVGPYLHGG